ncbi:MAG: hypothetical protein V3T30_01945 [Thermodesulfobacteriota bacterium]
MKKLLAITLALMIVLASSSVSMAEEYYTNKETTNAQLLLDIGVMRPLGLVATTLGLGFLLISLPFTAPTKTANKVSERLVVAPYKYTFERPVGYFE